MSFSAIVSEGRNSIRHWISCPFRLEFSNEKFLLCIEDQRSEMVDDDGGWPIFLCCFGFCLMSLAWFVLFFVWFVPRDESRNSSPLWTLRLRLAHRFAFLYAARSQQCHDWFTATHKRGWVAGWGSLFFYTGLLFHPVAFPSVQSVRWSTLHNVYSLCRFRWPRAPPPS